MHSFLARRHAALPAALATFVFVAATAFAPTPAAAAATGDVTILFNGSVRGELDDCGCPSRPLGGLARRAHVIEGLKATHADPILLDAGGLFGDPTADTAAQTLFLAEETAALGYELAGVGPYELGHGVDFVRQVAAASGLQFVSANVTRGGDLLFEPYRVIERNGVKVAVTSVFDPEYLQAEFMKRTEGLEATDASDAVAKWLPEMTSNADVVVVLSNLKQANTVRFLRDLKQGGHDEVDLIVDAVVSRALDQPRRFGTTQIVAANNRGKHVGQVDLRVEDGALTAVENTIHFLDLDLPEDEALAARVADFHESRRAVAGTK